MHLQYALKPSCWSTTFSTYNFNLPPDGIYMVSLCFKSSDDPIYKARNMVVLHYEKLTYKVDRVNLTADSSLLCKFYAQTTIWCTFWQAKFTDVTLDIEWLRLECTHIIEKTLSTMQNHLLSLVGLPGAVQRHRKKCSQEWYQFEMNGQVVKGVNLPPNGHYLLTKRTRCQTDLDIQVHQVPISIKNGNIICHEMIRWSKLGPIWSYLVFDRPSTTMFVELIWDELEPAIPITSKQ